MRLSSFAGKPNATLEAPNYGVSAVKVETVGYGNQIVQKEGGGRDSRTLYPFVRTSGSWYIEAVFSSVEERNAFHSWLLYYMVIATDQWRQPLPPITVTVPAVGFMKVGYVTSNISFGDQRNVGIYRSIVQFTSASDPLLIERTKSPYIPPRNDEAALHFYPDGIQESQLPPPRPDTVWVSPGAGGGNPGSPYDEPSNGVPRRTTPPGPGGGSRTTPRTGG